MMILASSMSKLLEPRTSFAAGSRVVTDTVRRDSRRTALHFIPGIAGGGAETMLGNLVENMHDGAWRNVIVAVDARPWPDQARRLRGVTSAFYDLKASGTLRPGVIRELRKIIREVKPDVVQTWMHHADFVGGITARLCGVRNVVWSIHCREIHRNPGESALRHSLFRTALRLASKFVPRKIISCSAAAIEDHAANGYPRQKMEWIANGICTDKFSPQPGEGLVLRQQLGLPADAAVIGYAGRFHEMKQMETFLRAAALTLQKNPAAYFVLCGGEESSLTDEAKSALSLLSDRSRIRFAPFRANMERFYSALTIFSLSSRTEACPMTLLEAMACGIPCAATDVGDCAALLGSRDFIAPPGDAFALSAAWEHVLSLSDDARQDLSTRLRKRVVSQYSIGGCARRYEAAYDALVATR